jgi:hypothetical protein
MTNEERQIANSELKLRKKSSKFMFAIATNKNLIIKSRYIGTGTTINQ